MKKTPQQANPFSCLALTDEDDPQALAGLQSKRAQKKLSRNSQHQSADDEQQPNSPGLADALAAIAEAERAAIGAGALLGSPRAWPGSTASSPSSSRCFLDDDLFLFASPTGSTTPTGSSSPLPGDASRLSREQSALLWQSFSADCAAAGHAAAQAASDLELQLGQLIEADPGAAQELLQQAEALGLHPAELLAAQQEAALQEAAGSRSASSSHAAAAAAASRGRSTNRTPAAAQSPPAEFPALPSPQASATKQGRPQHALPHGCKGGRLVPAKAKGITVINSRASAGSAGPSSAALRPSTLDLHWDLCLEGLSLKEDTLECIARGDGYQDAAAHARAAGQQEVGKQGGGSGSRDSCSQETLRAMMHKAGSKSRGAAAAGAARHEEVEEEPEMAGGGGKQYGYSWEELKDSIRAGGWVPVDKRNGAGGTHYKFRRMLPCGIVQTLTMPCTPSDSQRGVRNAASNLLKLDRERDELEAAARAAATAEGPDAQAACLAGVLRRKCR